MQLLFRSSNGIYVLLSMEHAATWVSSAQECTDDEHLETHFVVTSQHNAKFPETPYVT